MQSETVIFRASPEFVARLSTRAAVLGVSKSEALRRAVSATPHGQGLFHCRELVN